MRIEDRLQGARQRDAHQATADLELKKSAEAARLAAKKLKATQAAEAAEGARLVQIEADGQAAIAENAAQEQGAAQIEDRLQGARQSAAEQVTAEFEHQRRAEVDPIATGSISTAAGPPMVREGSALNGGPKEQSDNPTNDAARKDSHARQNSIFRPRRVR